MKTMRWAAVALAALAALAPRMAPAQVVVVTVKSFDELVNDLEYLATAVAPDDATREQITQAVASFKNPEMLKGVDRAKPWGAWATMPAKPDSGEPPQVVIAIPVTNYEQALANFEQFGIAVQDDAGVPGFTHKIGPAEGPLGFFAVEGNGYAYLSMAPTGADKLKATKPSDWLPRRQNPGDIQVALRLDQVPEEFRTMVLQQIEQQMADQREKKDGESEAEYQGRLTGMKVTQEAFQQLVSDGRDLNLDLNIDRSAERITLDLTLAAKPGSGLAQNLAGFGARASRFAALGAAAPAAAWANLPISKELRDVLGKGADDQLAEAEEKAKSDTERDLVKQFRGLIRDVFAADGIDLGLAMRSASSQGGAGKATIVGGVVVRDAKGWEDFVRKAAKASPPKEGELTLDAGTAPDGTKLHRLVPKAGAMDAEARDLFGEKPVLYAAFRKDVVLFTFGEQAEAALVQALKETAGAAPTTPSGRPAPPIEARIAVDKLIPLLPGTDEVRAEAAKMFAGPRANKGVIRLTLGGQSGDAVRLRLAVDVPALAFAAKLGAQAQAGAAAPGR